MPMAFQKSVSSDLSAGEAFEIERLFREAATLETWQEMRGQTRIARMMREARTDHLGEEEAQPRGNDELNTGAALQSVDPAADCGNQLRHAQPAIEVKARLCHGVAQPRFDVAGGAAQHRVTGGHHACMETTPKVVSNVVRGFVARGFVARG